MYACTYSKRRLRFFLSDVICTEKNLAECMQSEVQKLDSQQWGSFGDLGELDSGTGSSDVYLQGL
jgi:hypothetical protein